MFVAIINGLAAGALWALAFIAPGLVLPTPASDLALVRYAVFGVSSVLVLAILPKDRWWPVAKDHWRSLLFLSLAGNTLYYLLLSEALQRAGTLLPTLIIGTLPVVMALLGGVRNGQLSTRGFTMSAALILAGLLAHLGLPGSTATTDVNYLNMVIGSGLAVGALGSWAFYGLKNAELLGANQRIDMVAWTGLTGVATLLTLAPFASILPGQGFDLWEKPFIEMVPLLFWGATLGVLSSWLATWFWNQASRALSGELLGYLIVSETVFAILYAFLLEQRAPALSEVLSVGLLIVGVLVGIRVTIRRSTSR